jgi:hypothetical protein
MLQMLFAFSTEETVGILVSSVEHSEPVEDVNFGFDDFSFQSLP